MPIGADARRGLINTIAASYVTPPALRQRLLRWYGVTLGEGAIVRAGFYLDNLDLTIGEGSFINAGCYFDGLSPISIGARCDIGMEVMFCTSTHLAGGPDGAQACQPPLRSRWGTGAGSACGPHSFRG